MVRTSIEKMAYDIGHDIGHASDEDQANLINGLSHGLTFGCGGKLDMQLCYMAEHLSVESGRIIKELAGFVELKENS